MRNCSGSIFNVIWDNIEKTIWEACKEDVSLYGEYYYIRRKIKEDINRVMDSIVFEDIKANLPNNI